MRLGIASRGAGIVLELCGVCEVEAKQSTTQMGYCMSCSREPCAQIAIAKKSFAGSNQYFCASALTGRKSNFLHIYNKKGSIILRSLD